MHSFPASSQDARYRHEYRRWVASLPEEERQELEKQGLLEPETDRRQESGSRKDISERNLAADEPLPNQTSWDEMPDHTVPNEDEMWAAIRSILGELLSQDNIRLTLDCFALVTGITYMGDSMTIIARRYGVTRSAVSKRCVALSQKLNLNPSRAMRRLTARKVYAQRQSKILHRCDRFPTRKL